LAPGPAFYVLLVFFFVPFVLLPLFVAACAESHE
jgi:hypothetical protein